MRETTTINQNQNLDSSSIHPAINGFRGCTVNDYTTTKITKNDRNNNNVMKKSMPPPVPPKRTSSSSSTTANLSSNITKSPQLPLPSLPASQKCGVASDYRTSIASHNSGKSHSTTVINHVREQNALMNNKSATSNELHNVHHDNDKGTDKNDGEQEERTNDDDNKEKEKEEEEGNCQHCAIRVDNGVASTTVDSIAAPGIQCNGDNNNEKLNNVSLNQQRSVDAMRQPSSGTWNGMCSIIMMIVIIIFAIRLK